MRKSFVAGNWKMTTTAKEAAGLAGAVARAAVGAKADVAVCPPFVYLQAVVGAVEGSGVAVGAQNMYFEKKGAFTGEISAEMLKDVGCRYVILGHSERRHVIGEKDEMINRKMLAALAGGLDPILCVGEKLEERDADATVRVVEAQTRAGLRGVAAEAIGRVTIAYEPVWAIGTGRNATPQQAQDVHAEIRRVVTELYGAAAAQAMRIQYGGSVKPENAAEIMAQPDVDGALVGGASLKADSFMAIVNAAKS